MPDSTHKAAGEGLSCGTAWVPAPARPPTLHEDEVHVWRAELEQLRERSGLLCREEHKRVERFLDPHAATLWKRGRGLLRELIAGYVGQPPESLSLRTGPNGKPALEQPAALSFNLSHSGALAVYAFSSFGEVGVDVQLPRRQLDELALAARAFGPAHAERLALLEPPARARAFLQAWVRHEATVKWHGGGIASAAADERRPWVAELDPGLGAAAALAVDRRPQALLCWAVGS